MASIPERIGGQSVIKVLSNIGAQVTKIIDLSDVDVSSLADGFVLEYNADTSKFVTTGSLRSLENLNVTGITTTFKLDVIGIATFRNDLFVGGNLYVRQSGYILSDLNVFQDANVNQDVNVGNDVNVTGSVNVQENVNVVGYVTVREGLYYDEGDYDGPNGIGYFDNRGRLMGAASTEFAIKTSNYILTTIEPIGIPTWTSIIDGGEY